MADKLREYLIALGFNVDEKSYKKFTKAIATTSKEVAGLGAIATSTATAIAVSVEHIAREYEGLFYLSQRTRASVNDLKSFSFGMKQIGIDAGQSQAAIESFAASQRRNPGVKAFVGISGGTGKTPTEQLVNFVDYQKRLYGDALYFVAAMNAEMAGVPEETFLQIWNNLPKLRAAQEEGRRLRKEAGLDTKDLEEKSVQFANSWDHLMESLNIGKDRIAFDLMEPTRKSIELVDGLAQAFNRADVSSKGWLGSITGIGIALGGTTASIAVIARLLGYRGLVAGAAGLVGRGAVGLATGTAGAILGVPAAIYYGMGFNGATAGKEDDEPLSKEYRAKHAGDDTNHGTFDNKADKEAFIRASAIRAGIDPDIAMAVARSEGFGKFFGDNVSKDKDNPLYTSFGAFQLHVTPGGRGHAVGDEFQRLTGLDPSDPANEHESIMFALEWAKRHGWGDFHGAGNTGIGPWQGIGATALAPAAGSGSPVVLNQTNNNHIVAADAKEAGDALKGANDRSNADLLRNLKSAVR